MPSAAPTGVTPNATLKSRIIRQISLLTRFIGGDRKHSGSSHVLGPQTLSEIDEQWRPVAVRAHAAVVKPDRETACVFPQPKRGRRARYENFIGKLSMIFRSTCCKHSKQARELESLRRPNPPDLPIVIISPPNGPPHKSNAYDRCSGASLQWPDYATIKEPTCGRTLTVPRRADDYGDYDDAGAHEFRRKVNNFMLARLPMLATQTEVDVMDKTIDGMAIAFKKELMRNKGMAEAEVRKKWTRESSSIARSP